MRILLDECLPNQLRRELSGHHVSTVSKMGWAGTKNGALLTLADASFDVLLTVDQNMQYQQSLKGKTISIVVLEAQNNSLATLRLLVPKLLVALQNLQPGQVVIITP